MPEIKTLVERKPVVYSGLFRVDELFGTIKRFADERGYFMIEDRNEEKVLPTGKDLYIVLKPYRKFSDYAKSQFIIEIHCRKLTEKVVELEKHKAKYQEGEVQILFTVQLISDWRGRFEDWGFYLFLRTIMDKFVRADISRQHEEHSIKDCHDMQEEVKAYLNMGRFRFEGKSKPVSKKTGMQLPSEPPQEVGF